MKKLLWILLICILVLTGCEKKSYQLPRAEDFVLENGVTAAGIRVGDGPDAFQAAYKKYEIQVSFRLPDSGYTVMDIDKIPYQEEISTILACFYIDGTAMTEETISKKTEIPLSELHTHLSSPEYLREHEVLYRFLDICWDDGIISEITSDEISFNEMYETPCIR